MTLPSLLTFPLAAGVDPWIFTFSFITVALTIGMGFWSARQSRVEAVRRAVRGDDLLERAVAVRKRDRSTRRFVRVEFGLSQWHDGVVAIVAAGEEDTDQRLVIRLAGLGESVHPSKSGEKGGRSQASQKMAAVKEIFVHDINRWLVRGTKGFWLGFKRAKIETKPPPSDP